MLKKTLYIMILHWLTSVVKHSRYIPVECVCVCVCACRYVPVHRIERVCVCRHIHVPVHKIERV